MSYELNALIATVELLSVVAAEVPVAQVTRLSQGLALIPMTDRLHDALEQPSNAPDLGFKRFPGGFGLRLAAWSKAAPIAYAEADRIGPGAQAVGGQAVGAQRAAVWDDGRIVLGPLLSAPAEPLPADGGPIALALRRLGVQRGAAADELAALGLYRL